MRRGPLLLVTDAEDWKTRGACVGVDPDLFFPQSRYRKTQRRTKEELHAKAVCASCPVRQDCLEYALTRPEIEGIWGGHGQDELNQIRRRRTA